MTDLRSELDWLVEQFTTYLWCVEHEWGGPIEKYKAEEARAKAILSLVDAPPDGCLSQDEMLGPFFKDYADLGHWFDKAHGKCVRCGVATIDLYEDGVYGEIRACLK